MSIICKRCQGVILEEMNMPDEYADDDCDDCKQEDAREATRFLTSNKAISERRTFIFDPRRHGMDEDGVIWDGDQQIGIYLDNGGTK